MNKDLPALDSTLLPLAFRDYLEAVALAYQVPLEYPVLVAAGTIAAMSQGNITIQINDDYSECLSFYAAPVLRSGNRKSAVITEICKPANAYETERRKSESFEREQARAAYERQEEIVRAANSHKSKISSEDRAAEIQLLNSMEKPRPPYRLFAGDITPEKLTEMLCEHHSLACIESESSLLPNIAGRYSNGEASTGTVNRAWSAESLRFDRRGGQSFDCERSHFVWIAAAQPITLEDLQTNPNLMHTGLTNRFLFSVPQDLLGRRLSEPPPIPQFLKDSWAKIVRDTAEHCSTLRTLTTCRQGQALITQFASELEPRLGEGGDLRAFAGWASKLRGNLIRLAAIFQFATDPTAQQLDSSLLQLAFDSAEYWIAHAKQVLNPAQSRENRELLRKALKISTPFANLPENLQQASVSSVSVSESVQVFPLRELERTMNKQNAPALRSKLQFLVREDLLRPLPTVSTGGRPSEYYALSPYAVEELQADQQ